MKPHLQCAEQQVSRSNLTKYCACHAKLHCKISDKIFENRWNVISNAGPIRPWSDHDPSMIRPWSEHENANRNPPRNRGYFSSSPRAFSIEKYNVSRPILHSNIHQVLRLPRKVTLELHQVLHLPRKVTLELHQVLHLPRNVTLEPHQILRLLRKMTRMLDRRHIWNVIYNARSNRCHHPTSPNTAPATQNDSHAWSSSHMKRHLQCAEQQVSPSNLTKYCACHEKWLDCFIVLTYQTSFTMRGATGVTLQPHQMLRLPRKMTRQNFKENLQKQVKRHFQCGADPTMIREWSEHDPRMIRKRKPQPASQPRLLLDLTTSIFYCKIQRFAPNLTFKPSPNIAPATKSDTWTSPSTAPATKSDTWTSPSTAPAMKSDTWTSPNTAPATKNDSTAVSSSHMKRHFQCAEQQVSLSNLPKYCTCHEKWHCKMSKKISKNRWNVISNAGPIRPWSDHDPSMIREWSEHENANRNPPRNRGYFSSSPRAFSIEKYNVSRPILHSNLHQILRLPPKVPLELHQILRLPRKVTLELHQVVRLPRKVTLELHQVLRLPRKVTLELHQVLHLPRKVTLELHQVLRLPLYCNWTLLYSTLLDTTLLDSTLLDTILLDSTLLDSTLLDTILLASILLDSTLLDLLYLILLYLTLLYLTYSTWLYSWLYSTWLYSTWLYSTWRYSTWLYSTWLYSTWLYSTWPYST